MDRSNLDEKRAAAQLLGYATSIAARRHSMCDTVDDAVRIIRETFVAHGITDEIVGDKFEQKAKATGSWEQMFEFHGKEAA